MILVLVIINVVIINKGFTHHANWYGALLFTAPLLFIALVGTRRSAKAKTNQHRSQLN